MQSLHDSYLAAITAQRLREDELLAIVRNKTWEDYAREMHPTTPVQDDYTEEQEEFNILLTEVDYE